MDTVVARSPSPRASLLPLLAASSCLGAVATPVFAEQPADDGVVASAGDTTQGPIPAWVEDPERDASHAVPVDTLEPPAPERDWDAMPDPRQAHGMTVRPDQGPTPLIWVPRALLAVPRLGVEVAIAPVRGGLWTYERYRLGDRARQIFFDDDGVYGAYPVAFIETGFGLNVGARAVHNDLLGDGEQIKLRAGYGGRYRQIYELDIGSGRRFGDRVALELGALLTIEPKERFYGFGNADEVEADAVALPIDPAARDTAVATRYRHQAIAGGAALEVGLIGDVFVEGRSAVEHITFGGSPDLSGDRALEDTFMTGSLGAYEQGVDSWYNELRLGYDSRRPAHRYVSDALPGAGLLATAHLGRQDPIAGTAHPAFYRYGADLQLFLDLHHGSRILALRGLVEQVSGSVDEIPFVHLPVLGGDELLRGYPTDRFRDRALTLASAEYLWDLNRNLASFLFVDAGRVQRSLAEPEADGLRVGFGAGLQAHTMRSFLMRLQVATSSDGGVFFSAGFSPVIDVRVREDYRE